MRRVLAILCLCSAPSWGVLAIDVNVSTANKSLGSLTSGSFSSGANEVYILATAIGSAGIRVNTITTTGLTWTIVAFSSQTASGCAAEVWKASSTAALSGVTTTVNYTGSPGGGQEFTLLSFSGADLTGNGGAGAIGATNQHNHASAGATEQPACTLTTTRDQSFVVGGFDDFDAGVQYVAASGKTIDNIQTSSTNDTALNIRTTTNVTGLTSTTLNFTNATSTDGTAFVCVEVKAAVGGAAAAGVSKASRMERYE
jgi:hypothetical protein